MSTGEESESAVARPWRPLLLACGLAGALAACSQNTLKTAPPEEAVARAKATGGPKQPKARRFQWETVRRVQAMSFCYSAAINTAKDVVAEAREACLGGRLEYFGQDTRVLACPLLQPTRITYICHPPAEPASEPVSQGRP